MFSIHRFFALTTHYIYSMKRNPARFIEILVWPSFEVVLFGFLTQYMSTANNSTTALVTGILAGIVMWNFFGRIMQEAASQVLDDIFSRNFQNIFLSPITRAELIVSILAACILKLLLSITVLLALITVIYPPLLESIGFHMLIWMIHLISFGSALSLFVIGLILVFGERLSFVAWILSAVIQIFSGVVYERNVLPEAIRYVSYAIPSSYVFESVRTIAGGNVETWEWVWLSGGLILMYGIVGSIFFNYCVHVSRASGRMVKL